MLVIIKRVVSDTLRSCPRFRDSVQKLVADNCDDFSLNLVRVQLRVLYERKAVDWPSWSAANVFVQSNGTRLVSCSVGTVLCSTGHYAL